MALASEAVRRCSCSCWVSAISALWSWFHQIARISFHAFASFWMERDIPLVMCLLQILSQISCEGVSWSSGWKRDVVWILLSFSSLIFLIQKAVWAADPLVNSGSTISKETILVGCIFECFHSHLPWSHAQYGAICIRTLSTVSEILFFFSLQRIELGLIYFSSYQEKALTMVLDEHNCPFVKVRAYRR